MKKIIITTFGFILSFVAIFGAKPIDTNYESDLKQIDEVGDEYPVEDYIQDLYVGTECQDCLRSAESDGCIEIHSDCLDLPDCTDWLSCVGWCEALEADDECYFNCDNHYIDNEEVEVDLKICTCELCGMKCKTLCAIEEDY